MRMIKRTEKDDNHHAACWLTFYTLVPKKGSGPAANFPVPSRMASPPTPSIHLAVQSERRPNPGAFAGSDEQKSIRFCERQGIDLFDRRTVQPKSRHQKNECLILWKGEAEVRQSQLAGRRSARIFEPGTADVGYSGTPNVYNLQAC
jgi:hypothetical protein